MTEDNKKTEKPVEEIFANLSLYEGQVQKFRKAIESLGFENAIERYGFALFHSLPVEERLMYQRKYNWVPDEPEDTYNLANVHAMKDELDEAIKLWEAALQAKPELHDAIFNMALAYEKKGQNDKAAALYKQYMEAVNNEQESEKIQQHLSEING